jgi:hypothetical protein
VITDIDANVGQISGDFGEEIRLFERCERRVGLQPLRHREAARMHNLDRWAAIHLRWLRWRWRCRQVLLSNDGPGTEANHHHRDPYACSADEIHDVLTLRSDRRFG